VAELSKNGKEDVDHIKQFLNNARRLARKSALVLRQGIANAQGPDVMVVIYDPKTGSVTIELFQAKDRTGSICVSDAAKSLGVDKKATTTHNATMSGSAGYSRFIRHCHSLRRNCRDRVETSRCTVSKVQEITPPSSH
jgi:hypothetical protein